jgi:hypothetical protein
MSDIARHAWPADGKCANCATPLAGNWCHACGQRAADHHRSLRHLAIETVEGFTHADGRLWHTLFLLTLHPARLTLDYLRGRRASEIPPLRLFFVTLLMVFAAGSLLAHIHIGGPHVTAADATEINGKISNLTIEGFPRLSDWLRPRIALAFNNPDALLTNMREWAERFAFLLLPLSAIVLRLIFPLRRDRTLYDHLIFTMHSLSFAGLVWVLAMILNHIRPHGAPSPFILLLVMPVHLFAHMRGVYRTGWFSTLWRMSLLFWCSLGIFILLLTGLALVSLGTLEVTP